MARNFKVARTTRESIVSSCLTFIFGAFDAIKHLTKRDGIFPALRFAVGKLHLSAR